MCNIVDKNGSFGVVDVGPLVLAGEIVTFRVILHVYLPFLT